MSFHLVELCRLSDNLLGMCTHVNPVPTQQVTTQSLRTAYLRRTSIAQRRLAPHVELAG